MAAALAAVACFYNFLCCSPFTCYCCTLQRKFHCVHDVVLMGLPASMNAAQWRQARQVTSGRLVNVYCRTDWLLAFLYRWMEFRLQVRNLHS